jgi:hypothetical protein
MHISFHCQGTSNIEIFSEDCFGQEGDKMTQLFGETTYDYHIPISFYVKCSES